MAPIANSTMGKGLKIKPLDGRSRNRTGNARGPIKATNPIVIATLEAIERSGKSDRSISKRAGIRCE